MDGEHGPALGAQAGQARADGKGGEEHHIDIDAQAGGHARVDEVAHAQPRGLGAVAKTLSMDMRANDPGWLKLKLDVLAKTGFEILRREDQLEAAMLDGMLTAVLRVPGSPARVELAALAQLAGLSQSHYCRAFKASTGMAPYQWQLQARVERAKQLLIRQRDYSESEAYSLLRQTARGWPHAGGSKRGAAQKTVG